MPADEESTRRRAAVARALFWLLWLGYAYFYQSGGHNEAAHLDTARALASRGSFIIDEWIFNSADVVRHPPGPQGHFYSSKAPGTALLVAPVLAVWQGLLGLLPIAGWVRDHLAVWLTSACTVSLLSALAGSAAFRVLAVWFGETSALLAVLAVWLGSIVFPFSTLLFSHALSAALLALAALLLLQVRHGLRERRDRSIGVAGLLSGFAIACEYPAAIVALALGLYAIAGRRWREDGLRYALGVAPGVLLLAAHHKLVFGGFLTGPYQVLAHEGEASAFPAQAQGLAGVRWPGYTAFAEVMAEITLRPQRGLVYLGFSRGMLAAACPVLLLALPGLVLLARRRLLAELLLCAGTLLAMLTFNACYGDSIVYWGGGASVGPRHLIAALPLLALPLAAAAASRWRALLVPLLAVSMFFMLLATAVEPRAPYEVANPARDLYLARWLRGDLGLSRAGLFDPEQRLLTRDSVAGGVGEMAGLPGSVALLPLLLVWGGLAVAIGRHLRPARPGLAVAGVAGCLLAVALAPVLRAALDTPPSDAAGFAARYWPSREPTGEPGIRRSDPRLDFDWTNEPPYFGEFCGRWEGELLLEQAGDYGFRLESDDGSWLDIDGDRVLDHGGEHAMTSRSTRLRLDAGLHRLRVGYFNAGGGAGLRLWWTPPVGGEQILEGVILPGG